MNKESKKNSFVVKVIAGVMAGLITFSAISLVFIYIFS